MSTEFLVDPDFWRRQPPIHEREGIQEIIPHRGEMLLIDAILAVDTEKKLIVAHKDCREDEFWARGHFPGNPIVPGVILLEAAAQAALVYYKTAFPEYRDRLIVFGGIKDVRFRDVVRPPDRVLLVGKVTGGGRRIIKFDTQGIVNNRLVFDGEMIALPK